MPYLLIGVVLAGGAIIQGAIGFAFGIFAIPLLVLLGLPLEQAIALVCGLVVIQTVASVWPNRSEIPWSEVVAISVPRFIAVVAGVYLLGEMKQSFSPDQIKQVTGGCLLAVIAVQLWYRPKPRERWPAAWTWIAGCISGLMAGLIGMGGPPIVIWAVAHDWESRKSRMLLWCAFALMVPWQLSVAYMRFGSSILESALLGIAYIPVVVVASRIGNSVGSHLSQSWLRVIAYAILAAVAATSLLGPIINR